MVESIITENLIQTVSGASYLKVPKSFKEDFPNWKDTNPIPVLSKKNDKIRLCYEWDANKIEKK